MRHKFLIYIFFIYLILSLQACAVVWVADKTVDAAAFAVGTGVKLGTTAANATWETGKAVGDMAVPDDEVEEAEDAKGL